MYKAVLYRWNASKGDLGDWEEQRTFFHIEEWFILEKIDSAIVGKSLFYRFDCFKDNKQIGTIFTVNSFLFDSQL